MSKNKSAATMLQDARTVMLGRPPIQNSMVQQMFRLCVEQSSTSVQNHMPNTSTSAKSMTAAQQSLNKKQ